jgi:hypothetical membrane protein
MNECATTARTVVPAAGSTAGSTSTPRLLAILGLLGPVAAASLVGALHVLPETSGISPVSRTISEYALTDAAWAFNVGVIALAMGSLAILVAAAQAGLARVRSVGFVLGVAWVVALLTIVVFPKHNWAVGPSATGQIHRVASLVAFGCLPLAVILLARGRAVATTDVASRSAFWLAAASLGWFGVLVGAWLISPITGTPWYRALPIGLVERGLVLGEVAAVVAVGVWVLTSTKPSPARNALNNPAAPSPGSLQLRPPVLDGGLASSADYPAGHPGAARASRLIACGPTRQQPPTSLAPDATHTAACSGPNVARPTQARAWASQSSPLLG